FGAAAAAILVTFFGLYLIVSISFQYEAYALSFSPLKAAFGLVPIVGLMIPFAPIGPAIARRRGEGPLIGVALGLTVLGAIVLATLGTGGGYLPLTIGWLLFGGG